MDKSIPHSQLLNLTEQSMMLMYRDERLQALRNTTQSIKVLLARDLISKALHWILSRFNFFYEHL